MKVGDQVRYIGNTFEYLQSGVGDDPRFTLIEGNTYLIEQLRTNLNLSK